MISKVARDFVVSLHIYSFGIGGETSIFTFLNNGSKPTNVEARGNAGQELGWCAKERYKESACQVADG